MERHPSPVARRQEGTWAEVLRPGLLSSLQDLGRRARHLGVPETGVMDVPACRIANALVGNEPDAPVLELTLLGPTLRFQSAATIALCGAPFGARLDGASVPLWRAVRVPAGGVLDTGATPQGVRAVLAVRGGWQAEVVMESASTDLRGGFGGMQGRAIRKGDVLAWNAAEHRPVPRGSVDPALRSRVGRWATLHVLPTGEGDPSALLGRTFTVSGGADRMGLRLVEGVPSTPDPARLSEPTVLGGVQLPPGGAPIILLNDAGTHGGYLMPIAVIGADRGRLAQLRPGDRLKFVPVTLDEAEAAAQRQERDLRSVEAGLRLWWTRK